MHFGKILIHSYNNHNLTALSGVLGVQRIEFDPVYRYFRPGGEEDDEDVGNV